MSRCYDEGRFDWYECSGEDCEPPESGKSWLSIEDGDEEYCIIVHRGGPMPQEKYDRANRIVAALNRPED